jgi:hypothetical protein
MVKRVTIYFNIEILKTAENNKTLSFKTKGIIHGLSEK